MEENKESNAMTLKRLKWPIIIVVVLIVLGGLTILFNIKSEDIDPKTINMQGAKELEL